MPATEEVKALTEKLIAAAATGDFGPFVAVLDDDLEVFDHVPFRFENKESFIGYLDTLAVGAESVTYVLYHPSYRAISDAVAVVNSYDHSVTTPKDGGPVTHQSGRTTWVFAKRSDGWKIVSAHFSPLPMK